MLILLLILISGIITGRLFRNSVLAKKSGRIIFPIVLVLLFQMGIQIGSDTTLIHNLNRLGLEALLITVGALIGTIAGAVILWNCVFVSRKEKKSEGL